MVFRIRRSSGLTTGRARNIVVTGVVGTAVIAALTSGTALAAATHDVPATPRPALTGQLTAVDADSATDAWVVGANEETGKTITEHWDGSTWTPVAGPNPGGLDGSELWDVTAVSSDDAWAVGDYFKGRSYKSTIQHWDGTSWTQVASPNPSSGDNILYGVDARSANDVWAVGVSGRDTLVAHWDGTVWTQVPAVNPGGRQASWLNDVAIVSARNVWAVGSYADNTLVEHWDGSTWTQVDSPSPGPIQNGLDGVSATSKRNVWAVGDAVGGPRSPLALHWDGSSWQVAATHELTQYPEFWDVTATSGQDAWAVGYAGTKTLVEHWDGDSWHRVAAPSPAGRYSTLYSTSAVSESDAWAVGVNDSGGALHPLIEHWDGTSWTAA